MPNPRTAALYMRMSTERQDYSIKHQRHTLELYAAANGIAVVREYCDEGKSGLALKGRKGIRQLLDDVLAANTPFNTVLIYDVSRWGRFQDVDEAAHYEFICRSAGIAVLYCAEQFQNDGSALSSLVKTIKRAMAAEYSRELSEKVFNAQCRFVRLGFKQGGSAGFGLRRVSVADDGTLRRVLDHGERKCSVTDRVVYAQGPAEEVRIVRQIYRWFVRDHYTYERIAKALAKLGILNDVGKPWSPWRVRSLLSNEKYAGNLVFNKMSAKLGEDRLRNRSEHYVRYDSAFPGVVSLSLFKAAQREIAARVRRWTDAELLDGLRAIYATHGKLTQDLVNQTEANPSDNVYRKRFGSLSKAFGLAGVGGTRYTAMAETKMAMTELAAKIMRQSIDLAKMAGATATVACGRGSILINESLRVRIVICRRRYPNEVRPRWRIVLSHSPRPHFLLVVRLDPTNTNIQDFYLLPMEEQRATHVWLRDDRPTNRYLKHRYASLEEMFGFKAPIRPESEMPQVSTADF